MLCGLDAGGTGGIVKVRTQGLIAVDTLRPKQAHRTWSTVMNFDPLRALSVKHGIIDLIAMSVLVFLSFSVAFSHLFCLSKM